MDDDYSRTITADKLRVGHSISSRNGHGVCSTTVIGVWHDGGNIIVSTRLGHYAYGPAETVTISRY